MGPVVRVSIVRGTPENYDDLVALMRASEAALRPGIEALPGLIGYFVGADDRTRMLHNTSLWESVEAAEQMASFQPMLDQAKRFADAGAEFVRPIMNFEELWSITSS